METANGNTMQSFRDKIEVYSEKSLWLISRASTQYCTLQIPTIVHKNTKAANV